MKTAVEKSMFWSEIRSGVRGRLESGIQKIFCWYNPESWALESRIQLKESIILPRGIQNPGSSIRSPQREIHNPRLSWITLHQWGNTVLALVTLAQQQITHRSYLISLWLPSICQRAKGPYTWYFRRWRTFNSSDLRRQPWGFTRCIAERILLCWSRIPLASKRPVILLYPALGKSFSIPVTMSSSSLSFIPS